LLFMLFPQIWAYLSTGRAVVATTVAIAGLAVTAIGRAGWDRQAAGEVLPSMLLPLGLALLLGLFITGVIEQAERRAVLIDELERTRAELAETVHARGDSLSASGWPARPDVVLMDLRMPRVDGAQATARIVAADPDVKILVLTTYDTDSDIIRAVEAGATGYLLKDTPRTELAAAVRAAARGETVLAPAVAARLVSRLRTPAQEQLTPREPRFSARLPGDSPTPRSVRHSPSARPPSRRTCCASLPSSASTIAPPLSRSPTSAASCPPPAASRRPLTKK
jgi:CheY-like chemotaxis protein